MSARFRSRRSALTDTCGSQSPAPIVVDRANLAEAGEVSTRLAAGAPATTFQGEARSRRFQQG